MQLGARVVGPIDLVWDFTKPRWWLSRDFTTRFNFIVATISLNQSFDRTLIPYLHQTRTCSQGPAPFLRVLLACLPDRSSFVQMDGSLLVASQLSALFPSSYPIPVTSSQNDILHLPYRSDSETPPEHASFSTLFHTPASGTILLRLTHGGLMLELISLTTDISPLRFEFPAAVSPSPSILLWSPEEVHVLAVTNYGSLYRLVIPIREGVPQWQTQSCRRWYREYVIQNTKGAPVGLVQVQSTHCVAIGLPDGSLLRLETEYLGNEFDDGVLINRLMRCLQMTEKYFRRMERDRFSPPFFFELNCIANTFACEWPAWRL